MQITQHQNGIYDLIICGGGVAGLSLARQLTLSNNKLSILVLERLTRPLPEAAFKVGESTIESGAFYYAQTLQLEEYLDREHLEKLGLRYFFRGLNADFATRPEYGVAKFLPARSFQLDRGKLETHLRELIEQAGVELKEGVNTLDIHINSGSTPHEVIYQDQDQVISVKANWVVDAMGRRRFLQRKFGLTKKVVGTFNSAWWRVRGRLSVNDFVSKTNTAWHSRVVEDRWLSTNHLMGNGYWVWIIPLSGDNTSVGIVASEEFHPFNQYNTYADALAWLSQHEPLVAKALNGLELMDFKKLKNYSYSSQKLFSLDRWTCVGEAAVFADPYYSVGSNLIAFANGTTQQLIELERRGELTEEYINHCNHFFLTLNDALTNTIQRAYPFLYKESVITLKTIWDYYIGWSMTDPQLYHQVWLDIKLCKMVSGLMSHVILTQARMIELFEQWAKYESNYTFGFVDYIADQPTLCALHLRNFPSKTDDVRLIIDNIREAAERIEEVAQVIFFLVVRDVLPEKMSLFKDKPWINTAAISLYPDQWEKDGLFSPKTKPRNLGKLEAEFCKLFIDKQTHQPIKPILEYLYSQ